MGRFRVQTYRDKALPVERELDLSIVEAETAQEAAEKATGVKLSPVGEPHQRAADVWVSANDMVPDFVFYDLSR